MNLIYVEWKDAATSSGWNYKEDTGLMNVRSVGWLVKQDKTTLTITTSQSKYGKFLDPLSIPKHSISQMKVLKRYPG